MKETTPTLGFVISSHADPAQLLRLVSTLSRLYRNPPIACHHDFSQCPLDRSSFPDNVRFVEQHVRTSWGTWSLVRATLSALALLYRTDGPDWFVTLSAADYPVADPEQVLALYAGATCDAYIDVHAQDPDVVPAAAMIGGFNPALDHLETPASRRQKSVFYERIQFWLPRLRRSPRWRLGRLTVRLPLRTRFYNRSQPLFWGEAWFSGTRKIAQILLNPTSEHLRLQRFLRWRTFPEESYIQTVLANTAGLTLHRDNKRFTKWGGGSHPVAIGAAELAAAFAGDDHFARKFQSGSALLDVIDERLGPLATPSVTRFETPS